MSYQEQIITHYETVWNSSPNVYLWDKGPVDKLPHDFRILDFSPDQERNMWAYATCCMSQPHDIEPIELHIFTSVKDDSIIELLTSVAYYHRNTSTLGLNHTVNFGRPWQNKSQCEYGFISLPYLDGSALENMETETQFTRFYWLIPITKEEADFKKSEGVEALEKKFDEESFDYLNPLRKSIV